MPSPFSAVRRLSNTRLLRGLQNLAQQDRALEVDLLVHIAEVDARKLFLVAGYSSLFGYLVEALHFSDQAAYNRMKVARTVREHPLLLEYLRDGRLHLTSARLLAPRLTEENCQELLERVVHKSTRQVEEVVADLAPRPAAPELVRRLPEQPAPARLATALPAPSAAAPPEGTPAAPYRAPLALSVAPSSAPASLTAQAPARHPEPLGRERFKIQFTADRELVDTLREVQSLMRHRVPDGSLPEVFGRALRLLRDDLKRRKFGRTERPARSASSRRNGKRSRHVPNAIRRRVAERDGEGCAYVSPDGKRCGSKDFLEYEHEDAWAKHGVHRASRIRQLCRPHNQLAAQEEFGRAHMEQFSSRTQRARERGETPPVDVLRLETSRRPEGENQKVL